MTEHTTRPSAGRRVLAAVALVSAAAAFAVGIAALVRSPLQVIAAVLLTAVVLGAAWAALVSKGIRRVLAIVLAVLAIAGTFALPGLRTYLLFVVLAVLCALAAWAARVALGSDLTGPADTRDVRPARRGVLLMNPWSGGGKVERFHLADEARTRGVIPVELSTDDDLRELAEGAVAGGADVLGMAGGDGSQAIVADVASRHGIAFVCVPAGTRNHFALDLGLDREKVVVALDAFGQAVERRVDLAKLGDRVFVNNASLGVYATVVQSPQYREAKAATVAQQLPDLLGPQAERPDLRFTAQDGTPRGSADVLLVSNGAYRLDHLAGFGTRERLDSGELGIVTVTVDRARDVPALVSAEMTGRLSRFPGYQSWLARDFVVESDRPLVEVGVDGEALRLPPPLRFHCLPGALRVRVPRGTPGASPAAVSPTGPKAVATALLLVLAGRPARKQRVA
ncbi:diacylglycerol kinase family protein [Amycolatopsis sp. GM8]|uniref:diacylglycerol/lipid kinase family protein n=1 Tax=Amycolatopsis sp. GM8 TaxID=2896530 RepID=UPI001F3870C1|nr:diacylglycerol kinase family protein [Amycolatopsis sp. GM8]